MAFMIDASDVLQVDATVVVGILILLTISSFSNVAFKKWKFKISPRQATTIIVIPFSLSAILILEFYDKYQDEVLWWSTLISAIGFAYLIGLVFFLKTENKN